MSCIHAPIIESSIPYTRLFPQLLKPHANHPFHSAAPPFHLPRLERLDANLPASTPSLPPSISNSKTPPIHHITSYSRSIKVRNKKRTKNSLCRPANSCAIIVGLRPIREARKGWIKGKKMKSRSLATTGRTQLLNARGVYLKDVTPERCVLPRDTIPLRPANRLGSRMTTRCQGSPNTRGVWTGVNPV